MIEPGTIRYTENENSSSIEVYMKLDNENYGWVPIIVNSF